ncbi:MAG: helix-turn-helix transcriptional regulator [Phormidesmis sp.]
MDSTICAISASTCLNLSSRKAFSTPYTFCPVHSSPPEEENPLSKVRRLIQTDLSHPWRSNEVAAHFAISEATMRRWLAKSGQGFSKILQNTRLEHGLSLLQSTDIPILDIALSCGFKTPSHFSESFKKRFGIKPSEIRKAEN